MLEALSCCVWTRGESMAESGLMVMGGNIVLDNVRSSAGANGIEGPDDYRA